MRDDLILLVLRGGDKSTQWADIKRAKVLLPSAITKVNTALEEEKKREQASQRR